MGPYGLDSVILHRGILLTGSLVILPRQERMLALSQSQPLRVF